MLISLLLHVGSFVCLIEKKQNCVLNMLILPAEVLKNRSNMITCMKLSQYGKMAEFMISQFCCNNKSTSVCIIINSVTYVFN